MDAISKPVTVAMEGGGYYNRNSAMQAAGIARVLPLWEQIAATVPVGEETIMIADYGSSQGRNSMAPMRVAIAALRAASAPDRAVQVVHVDLPSNDFASLFQALAGEPDSYMTGAAGIFPCAIGRSYFEPVVMPGTVHLGWNSWTLQWLSRNPAEVADHLLAGFSADASAVIAVQDLAAKDWRNFIAARSCELRPGAKLLCLSAAASDDLEAWKWLTGEIWGAIVDSGSAGLLSGDEMRRMTLPIAARRLADIEAPFATSGTCCGMAIEFADVLTTPDPFWPEFKQTGDAAQLGRSWAGIWRGALGPALAGALDTGRDKSAVLDQVFSRFAARIAASPREQRNSVVLVILRKS
jgi:SAM dependent carboxyl methyltransferase